MKVTRRELVALAVAGVAVTTQEAPAQEAPEEQYKRNADALDQFELKQDTEPAFAFKA
jgi:hypothetical protein